MTEAELEKQIELVERLRIESLPPGAFTENWKGVSSVENAAEGSKTLYISNKQLFTPCRLY